jgi:hypothetical protein
MTHAEQTLALSHRSLFSIARSLRLIAASRLAIKRSKELLREPIYPQDRIPHFDIFDLTELRIRLAA